MASDLTWRDIRAIGILEDYLQWAVSSEDNNKTR